MGGVHYTFSYMTNTYVKLKRSIKQNGFFFVYIFHNQVFFLSVEK